MNLAIRPLTPDLWSSLEDLFADGSACSRCWCMYCRIGSSYRNRPVEKNKVDFKQIVERGPPPGLLAFDGDLPVAWCQVTPRDAVPWLDQLWQLKRIDDAPVWSISCLYVRKRYRRRGVTSRMIEAALQVARRENAPALEAYPFDASVSPSASGTGYASAFVRAGFKTIACRIPARPIMRHDLG
jgi:GNAT superfamily N-acetyltransferase